MTNLEALRDISIMAGDWKYTHAELRAGIITICMGQILAAESAPVPESAGLVEALRKLTAECQGFLSMADPETHGYTNTAVLRQRLEISRAALAAWESRNSGAAQKAEEE
jgi:hypothetical protein